MLIEWWGLSLSPMVCLQSATPREGSSLLDAEVGRAESPFAFQTESWLSTASHLKRRKENKSPLVTKFGCQWVVVEDGCGKTGMCRQKF